MLKRIAAPESPLSADDLKAHLRISDSDYIASLLPSYGSAAMQFVQDFTGRAVGVQTWDLVLDRFPCDSITIPLPPLQTVDSITYVDESGVTQTWATDQYVVDTTGGRVTPAFGVFYPATRDVINAVTIRFTAGYDTDLPESIRCAMLLIAADLYENREAQQDTPLHANKTVEMLLWPHRVF
jgi:uncharacterized phiE125 gp8 family phage protein